MTILTLPFRSSSQNPPYTQNNILKRTAINVVSNAVSTPQKITFSNAANQRLREAVPVKKMVDSRALGTDTLCNSKTTLTLAQQQSNRKLTYGLQDTVGRLLPAERVAKCLNCRVNPDRGVGVRLNKTKGLANYDNVMLCDSIWNCPLCHTRIMAKRGKEVERAIETWKQAGGSVFMLTLTHSHQRTDNLAIKMDKLRSAVGELFSHRTMRNIWDQAGKVGQIRALEITYSDDNGWHPHHHYLIFSSKPPEQFRADAVSVVRQKNGSVKYVTPFAEKQIIRRAEEKAQKEFKKEQKYFAELIELVGKEEEFTGRDYANKQELIDNPPTKKGAIDNIETINIELFIKHFWRKICTDVGLGAPSLEYGAVIEDASKVKTYLTKFKTAQELTNSQAKRAKGGSRNQWEILADAHAGDDRSGKLFQIYADAFKGERTIYWSKNLKKMMLIDEVEDSEIEEFEDIKEDEIVTIIELAVEHWGYIKRNKWRSELLEIVENDFKNDTDNLSIFIYSVKKLVEDERAVRQQKERERIANLCPPQWFDGVPIQ